MAVNDNTWRERVGNCVLTTMYLGKYNIILWFNRLLCLSDNLCLLRGHLRALYNDQDPRSAQCLNHQYRMQFYCIELSPISSYFTRYLHLSTLHIWVICSKMRLKALNKCMCVYTRLRK